MSETTAPKMSTGKLYTTHHKMMNMQTLLTPQGIEILRQIHNELIARGLNVPKPFVLRIND